MSTTSKNKLKEKVEGKKGGERYQATKLTSRVDQTKVDMEESPLQQQFF